MGLSWWEMATSRKQRNVVIDCEHHAWYKRVADLNPFVTMMSMMRDAHNVYQKNYALMDRVQRHLQDGGVYLSNVELVGLLLRLVIYKKINMFTVVSDEGYCSSAVE